MIYDYIIVALGLLLLVLLDKYRSNKDSLILNCFGIVTNLLLSAYLISNIIRLS